MESSLQLAGTASSQGSWNSCTADEIQPTSCLPDRALAPTLCPPARSLTRQRSSSSSLEHRRTW